ncbi:hypothetical protein SNEBB_002923 [Seison nebaliae]|nr:hypothetical protein SNEBB_002923 [Seison nebaliae]
MIDRNNISFIPVVNEDRKNRKYSFFHQHTPIFLTIILFFLWLTVIICLSVWFNDIYLKQHDNKNYALVFDAGSSKTRIYLYQWLKEDTNEKLIDNIENLKIITEIDNCKATKKGIANYVDEDHLEEAIDGIKDCLKKLEKSIPNEKISSTYIMFAATAGMRLLLTSNRERAEIILMRLRQFFKGSPYRYISSDQVKILTGDDEAFYGWLATNYYLQSLTKKNSSKLVGFLDLGGASTQISYPLPESYDNEKGINRINMLRNNFKLYLYSYLCYGANEAYYRYLDELLKLPENVESEIINDYCTFRDYPKQSINLQQLVNTPCTNMQQINLKKKKYVTLIGESNINKCQEITKRLFNNNTPLCDPVRLMNGDSIINSPQSKNCPLPAQSISSFLDEKTKFYAVSSFYWIFHRIGGRSYKEMISNVNLLCDNRTYQSSFVQKKLTDEIYKHNICFRAMYAIELLKSYGLEKNWENIIFTKKLNKKNLVWTVGFMLHQLQVLEGYLYQERISSPVVLTCMCLLGVCIILLTFLLVHRYRSVTQSKYEANARE